MIKFFHKLSKKEFDALPDGNYSWGQCSKDYPQPSWCNYPDAVAGEMGCWSLMDFRVTGRAYCKNCNCYIKRAKKEKDGISKVPCM